MSIKGLLKRGVSFPHFENTVAHENDIMIIGETLLTTKMMMWDSDKFFVYP